MTPSANPNQALWEKGDFTRIAAAMRDSGDALVRSLGVGPGMHVLDLGCGDGTTAVPAAKLGAMVRGVDIARNLVEAGERRASAEGIASRLSFEHGDACNLSHIENGTFDLSISIFGAMFAPKPFQVASEMVRVTRKGGRVVMGNWIPGDPTMVAQLLKISSAYTPPPPEGFVSPMTWGVESHIHERFGAAGVAADDIECTPDTFTFRFRGTPQQFVDAFRQFYGPTMNAFDAAQKSGRGDALRGELEELFRRVNTSSDPALTVIPATYMRITARVN
jgi:SAM-dependent methyltransferase